jgi:hypothetical protein
MKPIRNFTMEVKKVKLIHWNSVSLLRGRCRDVKFPKLLLQRPSTDKSYRTKPVLFQVILKLVPLHNFCVSSYGILHLWLVSLIARRFAVLHILDNALQLFSLTLLTSLLTETYVRWKINFYVIYRNPYSVHYFKKCKIFSSESNNFSHFGDRAKVFLQATPTTPKKTTQDTLPTSPCVGTPECHTNNRRDRARRLSPSA